MRFRSPFAILLLGLPLFGFHLPFVYAEALAAPSVVTIDGLGKGTVDLSGPWRFHIGDDLHWAEPGFNDTPGENGWETILADRPWGAQRHYAYTGFAWYRLNLRITPAPDVKTDFQLLLSPPCKTLAKFTGMEGWWAGTESCLRTHRRRL